MPEARQENRYLTALFGRLVEPLQGKAWWTAATLVFCGLVSVVTYHLWSRHGDRVVAQDRYRLNPERLKVTPQPEWIRGSVLENAVTHGRLNQANLLDKTLVLQVKQAFGVQPWVKRVTRINKQFPSTVEVDLEYRRPVAMVEVPAGMFPPHNYAGIVPIDEEGYLLPTDQWKEQTQGEAQQFPKIAGVDTSPAGPPGNPWGDARVADAARIVLLLEPLWKALDLYQVEVPPRTASADGDTPEDYVLITQKRRRFNWQSPPGKERSGEHSAREKIDALRQIIENRGTLDDWQQTDNAKVSDLIQQTKRR